MGNKFRICHVAVRAVEKKKTQEGGGGGAKQCQDVCVRGQQSRKPGGSECRSHVATSGAGVSQAGQPGPSL